MVNLRALGNQFDLLHRVKTIPGCLVDLAESISLGNLTLLHPTVSRRS